MLRHPLDPSAVRGAWHLRVLQESVRTGCAHSVHTRDVWWSGDIDVDNCVLRQLFSAIDVSGAMDLLCVQIVERVGY